MAPKKLHKVMKKATKQAKAKSKALEKASALEKAKAPAKATALGKAKAKALGKAKVTADHKNQLNKRNLEKLGEMSLNDKIKAAAEEGESIEEQALALKQKMTKDEHSKLWGRYSTHLNKNPLEKEEVDALPKKEKGMKAAEWLMAIEGKKYVHVKKAVAASQKLKKEEAWESEKTMLDRFGKEELEAHLWSGRITYRKDPNTPGVYQYQDTQCWTTTVEVNRTSSWEHGTEMNPGEEEEGAFNELYDQGWKTLGKGHMLESSWKGKGFGKGQTSGPGKGKGKKGKEEQLAIKDKEEENEESEEDSMPEALKKARKARDTVASVQSNLEEALEKASSKLSRQGKAGAEGWCLQLKKLQVDLKSILSGKKKQTPFAIKEVLEETAKVVKGAKEETKELKGLANKTCSVASSKRSKGSK